MYQGTENFVKMLFDKTKVKQDRVTEKKDFNKHYKEDLVCKWNASNAQQYLKLAFAPCAHVCVG